MIARLISLVFVVLGALATLVFVVAASDYRNLGCWEMPANQCSDAVWTMQFLGLIIVLVIPAARWLWLKGRTDA